jgi:hypothetical protein
MFAYISTFPESRPHEEVMAQINRMRDFSSCSVPLPKFRLKCPQCGIHKDILAKNWKYWCHTQAGSNHPYRCDIWVKCFRCSLVWTFGLVVPKDIHPEQRKVIHYREVKKELEEAGHKHLV